MRALILKGLNKLELIELPIPAIQTGEILVKMGTCGICGTDIEKVRNETSTSSVLGHEVVGEVVEVGKNVSDINIGDRVFVHHHVSCGRCRYCLSGSATMCKLFAETNIEPGGFSEFFRVAKINVDMGAVLQLPNSVSFDEATFIEPLGCCLRSLARCGVKDGLSADSLSVVVIGCGPIGLLLIKCLKIWEASIIIAIDLLEYRLAFAHRIGANVVVNPRKMDVVKAVKDATDNRGADLVIVASGNVEAFSQATCFVRRGGVISVFGAPPKYAEIRLRLGRVFYDEVTILPSYSTTEIETKVALELIRLGRIDVKDLVTHSFDLSKVVEAFKTVMDGDETLKVLVTSS